MTDPYPNLTPMEKLEKLGHAAEMAVADNALELAKNDIDLPDPQMFNVMGKAAMLGGILNNIKNGSITHSPTDGHFYLHLNDKDIEGEKMAIILEIMQKDFENMSSIDDVEASAVLNGKAELIAGFLPILRQIEEELR